MMDIKLKECDVDEIVKRWTTNGFIKEKIPNWLLKDTACALENQLLLNNVAPDVPGFMWLKSVSFKIVSQLMNNNNGRLRSRMQHHAGVVHTNIKIQNNLLERFACAMDYHTQIQGSSQAESIVGRLSDEIYRFIVDNQKTSMCFLGITLDDNRNICFYYDWE